MSHRKTVAGRRPVMLGLLASTFIASGAMAQERTFVFDVPAAPLADALRDYGRAADRQLIFTPDLVRGRLGHPVQGRYPADQALDRLLDGSDLTWRRAPAGGIMIVRRAAAGPPVLSAAASADAEPSRATVAAVEVVGTRLARTTDGPAPVTVLGEQEMKKLGVSTLAEVLNYVPQVSFYRDVVGGMPGARGVQLRGLAPGTTLILINGRRAIPGALGAGNGGLFDLNTVPMSAVERVEILADSASAVYGADAVGGVVNIVLRNRIERPVLEVSYGAAEDGADERRASFAAGVANDRARLAVSLDYFDRDNLRGYDRDILANADYRRFGGVDRRVTTTVPGNICAVSGNLPGLSTPCAAVPAGSTGVGLTRASFAATAGQQNLDAPLGFNAVVPESERYSATLVGDVTLAPWATAFGEFMYADRTDKSSGQPPAISRGLVAAGNPFNPFGTAVRADFRLDALGAQYNTAYQHTYRVVGGLKGDVGGWGWEASAIGVNDTARYVTRNLVDATRVAAALAATNPAQALNPFQDGPGGSAALLDSLRAPDQVVTAASRFRQLGGFVRGDLLTLPAGPVQVVAGAEWRRERIAFVAPAANFFIQSDRAKRVSRSAYAETRIPILAAADGPTLAQGLSVTLAGRYDDYSDFGSTFNMQYGIEWRPMPTLLLRGSYGDSFRAPNLYDLYSPQLNLPAATVIDPRRNESVLVPSINGGNPNLDAETSTSWSVGAVWTPDLTIQPRFSASYWHITQDRRVVSGLTSAIVLANEAFLPPGRVTRGAPSAADIAAGRPGPILSIDRTLVNLGRLETTGVDLEAQARFDFGAARLTPRLAATWVDTYKSADFATSPFLDRVGIANTNGTIPRWKVVGTLTYARDEGAVSLSARYVSGYADAAANVANGRHIDAQVIVDGQVSLDLGEIWGERFAPARGVVFRLGATNLFDKLPQYSTITTFGYDYSQANIRGRFVYAALAKTF